MRINRDKVLVYAPAKKNESAGGILLPEDRMQDDYEIIEAKVKDVGKFSKEEYPHLLSGDRVVFSKLSGVPISIDDEDFLLVDISHVLMILGNKDRLTQ